MDYSRKFTERWEMLNEMYGKQALSYTYHNKTSLKQGAYIHQPCYCPGDMAVRMREVLVRPWVGVCVPLALSLFYFCVRDFHSGGLCIW